jgi:hypothetical protein
LISEIGTASSAEQDPEVLAQASSAPGYVRRRRRLLYLVVGLVSGAFLARLLLELAGRPWHPLFVLAVGALLVGAGGAAGWLLSRADRHREPISVTRAVWVLIPLGLYVVWPRRQPALAMASLILVSIALLLDKYAGGRRSAGRATSAPAERENSVQAKWANGIIFILFFVLYLITTAPDVLPSDSGEFQIAASLLGVAHPPGYPLYTLLGWLSTKLIPLGNQAYRLNLLSAVFAAATLTLLSAATRHWARQLGVSVRAALVGGLVAALTLGTAATFWAQATIANIRMPTMFAAALGLYALARYACAADRAQADRALILLALALGLGIGHHPSLAFLGVFFLVYLVLVDPPLLVQPGRWWKPALAFLVALLPLLYLPLRGAADAPLAPPDLDTLDGFLHHVTAQGFEGDMFAFANAQDLPNRLILVPTLFRLQFNPVLLVAAALGLLVAAVRDWRLLVLLAGGLGLHTFVSITYRAPQTVEYLMPAYLPISVSVGLATAWLLSFLETPTASARRGVAVAAAALATLLAAVIVLAGAINGTQHGPSFFILKDDRSTREAMESILDRAPQHASVLADWRWATPLWYLQWVEGQRPDVEVQYVWPVPGQEYGDTWRERIDESVGERPLVLTHFYGLADYVLEPLGQGFLVNQRPNDVAPQDFSPLNVAFAQDGEAAGVRLLGYHLGQSHVSPGGALELALAWQPVGEITAPPSFTVWLETEDGRRLTAADRFLVPDYTPDEVRYARLVLPLYPDIPPGDHPLKLGVYSSGEQGFETWSPQHSDGSGIEGENSVDLATLSVQPRDTKPVTLHPLSVPFEEGPTLVGVDYDRSIPDTLRVYLHWRGPAGGQEQVNVGGSTAQLPALPRDGSHTTVLHLPGETAGRLALTLSGPDGETHSLAGPWGWTLQEAHLPAPSPSARFVPFSDELALIDVAPASGESFAPGDELLVRLTFLALKPLVSDHSISVRLLDQEGKWRYLHDLQPGLGAIPTLKWIRGARVVDPHPIPVPWDMDGERMGAALVVYERFRGDTLPPMDARMDGVPLGEWRLQDR